MENNRNIRDEKESIYYGSPRTMENMILCRKEPQIKPGKRLQKMNNSTLQCTAATTFGKQYLANTHVFILIINSSALLLGNIILNSMVIYLLVKTQHLSNYSNKFAMLLSSSDLVTALTTQTLQISILYLPLDPSCSVSLLTQFFSTTFTRISAYTIGLIGLDRYVRIRYIMNF